MLTEEQQFKVAFLAELADQGIGPDEAHTLVKNLLASAEKRADFPTVGDITSRIPGFETAAGLFKGMGEIGVPLGIAANFAIPSAVGAAGGYALAKMQDIDDEDPAELRTRESIQNYRRLAAELAVQRQLRDNRLGHDHASRPLVR